MKLDTVLPFFDDVKHLNTKDYNGYSEVKGVYCPSTYIIPFQLRTNSDVITNVSAFRVLETLLNGRVTGEEYDLNFAINSLIVKKLDGFVYIISNAYLLYDEIPFDNFIFKIEYDGASYFSELVTKYQLPKAVVECISAGTEEYVIGVDTEAHAWLNVKRTDNNIEAFDIIKVVFSYNFPPVEQEVIQAQISISPNEQRIDSHVPNPITTPGQIAVNINSPCGIYTELLNMIEPVIYEFETTNPNNTFSFDWSPDQYSPYLKAKDEYGNVYIGKQPSGGYAMRSINGVIPASAGKVAHYGDNIVNITYLKAVGNFKNIIGLEKYSVLEQLWLYYNQFVQLPSNLNTVPLRELNVQNNKLTSLAGLENTNLEWLNAGYNQLSNIDAIVNNTNLTYLYLRSNNISSLPVGFGNLINLNELHLEYNSNIQLNSEIQNLSSLTKLYLNNCGVPVISDEIGLIPNLQYLWLNNNGAITLPDGICNSPSLLELYCDNSGINTLPVNIGNISTLKKLTLYKTGISNNNGFPASFSNLQLEYLSATFLESGQIPDISLMPLIELYLQCDFTTRFPILPASLQKISFKESQSSDFEFIIQEIANNLPTNLWYFGCGYNGAATFPTNINLLPDLVEINDFNWDIVIPSTISQLTKLERIYHSHLGALSTNLYACPALRIIKVDYVTEISDGINQLTTLEELYGEYIYDGSPNLTYCSTDIAQCFNLKKLWMRNAKLSQANIEALIDAFYINRANFVNSPAINISSQTPAIIYNQTMIDKIQTMQLENNFIFYI